MTQTDGFFLERAEQRHLREKLATVPRIAEDIAITETMQARTQRPEMSSGRRPKKMGYRIPFHLGAAAAAHDLRASLAAAVRHTCEYRGIEYWPVGFTHLTGFIGPLQRGQRRIPDGYDTAAPMVTAKWLWKYVGVLAMTEGAPEFADAIVAALTLCEREIEGPVEKIVVDPSRVKAANKSVVTLSTIDGIAKRIGADGKGLNRERLRYLAKQGQLKPSGQDRDTRTKFYRLGDVLEAHSRVGRKPHKDTA